MTEDTSSYQKSKSKLTIANEEIKRLKKEVFDLNNILHSKNKMLDAMHWVWCQCGCNTGVHRHNDLPPLTEELVCLAERNTARMRQYLINTQYKKKEIEIND